MDSPVFVPGQLLTEAEAAQFLRVSPETLRAWRSRKHMRGRGPDFIKLGPWRATYYLRADLGAWLLKHKHKHTTQEE